MYYTKRAEHKGIGTMGSRVQHISNLAAKVERQGIAIVASRRLRQSADWLSVAAGSDADSESMANRMSGMYFEADDIDRQLSVWLLTQSRWGAKARAVRKLRRQLRRGMKDFTYS